MLCHILVLLFSNKVNIWLIHVSRANVLCQDGPAYRDQNWELFCWSQVILLHLPFSICLYCFRWITEPLPSVNLSLVIWLANMSHWPVQLWVLEITCLTGCCVSWCLPCCRELIQRSLRKLQWLCWTAVTLVNVTQLRPWIFSVHWKQRIGERYADVSHWREMNSLSCMWLLPVLLLCLFYFFLSKKQRDDWALSASLSQTTPTPVCPRTSAVRSPRCPNVLTQR